MPFVVEHARREALVEVADLLTSECFQEPDLAPIRDNRDGLEDSASGRAEAPRPPEYNVPDRARNVRVSRREHLGDEERVPRRLAVEIGGIDWVERRQHLDGLE
jgi:hypothetical protein